MTPIWVRALIVIVVTEFLLTSSGPVAQFLNISTRGFVGVDDHALIGGFILRGSVARRILIRGMSPSLGGAGLSEVLSDPVLELRDQNGTLLFASDNGKDTEQTAIEATGLGNSQASPI